MIKSHNGRTVLDPTGAPWLPDILRVVEIYMQLTLYSGCPYQRPRPLEYKKATLKFMQVSP
jgi:hypothetical protein